jgi:hypothetical protein
MFIISFPRSGQHLFERLLKHIYNYYGKKFSYCEFYNCCKQIPCNKESFFQKNHDFGLNLELKLDEKFIILYRKDKIYQLESYFRLNYFNMEIYNSKINYEDEIIFNDLIKYIKGTSEYYDGFVNKYIKSNKYKQSLIIAYDDFLSEYKVYIKQIILFLNLINSENIDLDSENIDLDSENIDLDIENIDLHIENIVNTFEKIEYKNSLDNEIYKKINKKLLYLEEEEKKEKKLKEEKLKEEKLKEEKLKEEKLKEEKLKEEKLKEEKLKEEKLKEEKLKEEKLKEENISQLTSLYHKY